eukprot:1708190-Rhodomonas_salina.1
MSSARANIYPILPWLSQTWCALPAATVMRWPSGGNHSLTSVCKNSIHERQSAATPYRCQRPTSTLRHPPVASILTPISDMEHRELEHACLDEVREWGQVTFMDALTRRRLVSVTCSQHASRQHRVLQSFKAFATSVRRKMFRNHHHANVSHAHVRVGDP